MIGLCVDCGTLFGTTLEDASAPDCRCASCYRERARTRAMLEDADRARHARVLSGTGDSGERRELAAFLRGLRT